MVNDMCSAMSNMRFVDPFIGVARGSVGGAGAWNGGQNGVEFGEVHPRRSHRKVVGG